MPSFEVRLNGLAELQRRLDALRTDQAAKILRKGLRAGAALIQAEMAARAPVRPPLPSGTALPPGALKSDIEIHSITRGVPEGAAAVTVGPGKYTRHVARWVEFGHRLVAGGRVYSSGRHGEGSVIGQVEPQPFLRPAFEASQGDAVDAFQSTVKTELDKLQTQGGK